MVQGHVWTVALGPVGRPNIMVESKQRSKHNSCLHGSGEQKEGGSQDPPHEHHCVAFPGETQTCVCLLQIRH